MDVGENRSTPFVQKRNTTNQKPKTKKQKTKTKKELLKCTTEGAGNTGLCKSNRGDASAR
jgi:hypothetical protein